MIQKKICLLGAYAVGKTSLVLRFVRSVFSESYSATVGVRIYKKEIGLAPWGIKLIVWDLAGENELVRLRTSYLRGCSGYILVVDGTRPATLEKAIDLQRRAFQTLGPVPFVLVVNKNDRRDQWSIEAFALDDLRESGWTCLRTSAKTGEGVELAFQILAEKLIDAHRAATAS
ncbi:MAG: GTP-binding protein [Bryobacteraceae bacterium]|nr:GTP-binding protein [Bryobacteraceae bacterium]